MDPANPRILYASTWRFRRTPYSLESGGDGLGALEVDRRRRHLERADAQQGPAQGNARHHRRRRLAVESAERLRHRRGRRRAASSARATAARPGRRPATPRPAPARLVLHAHLRRSEGRGRGLRRQRPLPQVEGRRQDLHRDPHAARRQPRSLDRSERPAADDRGQRRRRQRLHRRRRDLDDAGQPAHRAVLPRLDRHPLPLPHLGAQQDNSAVRIRHRAAAAASARATGRRRPAARAATSSPIPKNPDIVYGGSYGGLLTCFNHRTGEIRDVNPWPDNPMGYGAADIKYRFQWNFPIVFSPNDPNTLYAAAQTCWSDGRRRRAGRRSAPT